MSSQAGRQQPAGGSGGQQPQPQPSPPAPAATTGPNLCAVCRRVVTYDVFSICCDKCDRWVHGHCIDMEASVGEQVKEYYCPKCQDEHNLEVVYATPPPTNAAVAPPPQDPATSATAPPTNAVAAPPPPPPPPPPPQGLATAALQNIVNATLPAVLTGQQLPSAAAAAPAAPLLVKIREHNVDATKIIYYTTRDRGVTILKASNNKDDFDGSERILELNPNTINAIRYGFDGQKGVWQARFSNFTHEDHQGWYDVDRGSLANIDADLFANAKREPMKTVELADGKRENTVEDLSACGLAHLSVSHPVLFRADRTGDASSCVLAAYGNVISMSINSKQKGLEAVHDLLKSDKKLLCKDAANKVCKLTNIQTAKVKMSTRKLYPTLLSKGENGKFMGGQGGLYVASPETAEGAAGHMIGIDADQGQIYDCAEQFAMPLTVDNLDRCAGDNAMCMGILRMRQVLPPIRRKRGKAAGYRERKKQKSS
eukprot:SAG25_NODE_73_length_17157_cov_11.762575_9_plen_483_part_00